MIHFDTNLLIQITVAGSSAHLQLVHLTAAVVFSITERRRMDSAATIFLPDRPALRGLLVT
jgi:hypothetical protein